MKVLFMTNIPSPYRVNFFNEFGKLCDLTVTFEKTASDERDMSWKNYRFDNFKGVFLKGISINTDTAVCFDIIKYVKDRSFDKIICADFSSPTGMIAIQYMRNHGIEYWLESDGGFAKNGKGIKEKVKKYFISGAGAYFSTSDQHDKYYTAYGAEPDKIYRYPFTSHYKNDILDRPLSAEEKLLYKKKLGLPDNKMILYVGQFIERKGIDILLKSISNWDEKYTLVLVGGKKENEYLQKFSQYISDNISIVEFKLKDELSDYYKAADLFVLPTRYDIWGLVINEAMAYGIPVITTDKCVSGLELIENELNGYITETENTNQLASKINRILSDDELRLNMAVNNLSKIRNYTIEEMAAHHMEVLEKQMGEIT